MPKEDLYQDLETERLLLRKIALTDRNSIWEMFANYDYYKLYYPEKYEKIENLLISMAYWHVLYERGNFFLWGITIKGERKVIGMFLIHSVDTVTNSCDLSCIIHPEYVNKGYATEALNRVLRFAIETLGYSRVYACVVNGNLSSERVLQKAGMIVDCTAHEVFSTADGEKCAAKRYMFVKKLKED